MIDWANHKMVFVWLKNNLDHYQYLTQEALHIKNRMSWNNLESEEEVIQFGRDYEQFALLMEENPLTLTDINGNPAAILADDFYFYFYTTKQNVILPIGLQIEMGILNTKDKAREFEERLSASFEKWKEQYNAANIATTSQETLECEMLLKKNPSEKSYLVQQIILLILICLCMYVNVCIVGNDWRNISSRSLFVLQISNIVAAVYLLKSVIWIKREKKRRQYIKVWKAQEQEDKGACPDRYRSADGLDRILNEIKNQSFKKSVNSGKVYISNLQSVSLEDLNDIKRQKILYTVRPIHLIAMLMVTLCCVTCASDYVPQYIKTVKQLGEETVYGLGIPSLFVNNNNYSTQNIIKSMEMKVVVKKNKTPYYQNIDNMTVLNEYDKGSVLGLIESERAPNGNLFYHVIDSTGTEGYVAAKRCRLKTDKAVKVTKIEVYDNNGKKKDNEDVKKLIDGAVNTFVEFHKGDMIKMTFEKETDLNSIYILNGRVNDKQETDGISLAYIQAGYSKKKVFFEKEYHEKGDVISLKTTSIDTLSITIRDTADNSDTCKISELMLCK